MEFTLFSGKELDWVRYWCPYPGSINCGSSGAFLSDPEERFFGSENKHLRRTSTLLPEYGPLVLCGEPGLGKSTELQSITAQCTEQTGDVLFVDFREIADFASFIAIVIGSSKWGDWVKGKERLTLIIDGVDEGIMRIPLFIEALTGQLRRAPVERLRLLLACRTADWPTTAQSPLFGLWKIPESAQSIFELCPLRREDVAIAASACNVDSQKFLSAVYQSDVGPLAARPVTLAFLLSEFRATGSFGKTHRELYEKGTRTLCSEHDARRSDIIRRLRKTETIATLEERLQAAGEIASLLILSGQASVAVTEETPYLWLAALETALFTSGGLNKFTFIHRTIAECLASKRLAKLHTLQLRRLLCRRDGQTEYVVPQLAELAAWTAGYNYRFLEHLLQNDPAVLLRSDVTRIQGTHKTDLIEALLKGAEREEIFDDYEYRRFYPGLSHAGLARQLRPYIAGKDKGYIARVIAFEIAEKSRLPDLVDDLFSALRDGDDDQRLREAASGALCDCIPEERLAELIPLAKGQVGPDPEDSIRGDALRKLVPKVWAVRDALSEIHAPRNRNFRGSYDRFLRYDCPANVTEEDIIPLLGVLGIWQGCFDSINPRKELAEKVFCMALARLTNPEISARAVELWLTKARNHHPFIRDKNSTIFEALNDDSSRRAFVSAILNDERTTNDDLHLLISSSWGDWGILRKEDLKWLLEALGNAPANQLHLWIATVQTVAWWWTPGPNWDLFIAKRTEIPELATAFPLSSEIDSSESRLAKARHLRRIRRERRFKKHDAPRRLDANRRIANDLRGFREGKEGAWYRLFYDLSLGPESTRYEYPQTRVIEMPGWTTATDTAREEYLVVAREFLLKRNDGYAKFDGPAKSAEPGIHAIELLKDEVAKEPALREAVSSHWIRAITGCLTDDDNRAADLFALAYKINPGATIAGMLSEAEKDCEKFGHVFSFRRGKACWDKNLSKAALEFIDRCTSSKCIGNSIQELSSLDREAAEESVRRSLDRFLPHSSMRESLAETITSAMKCQLLKSWDRMFFALLRDDDFARSVLLDSAHDVERSSFSELTEVQLTDLYLLMTRLFPAAEDPPSPNGFVSKRQSVTYARGGLLTTLSSRANKAACDQFLRLAEQLPNEATWLRLRYRNTLNAKRRSEWLPLNAEIIDRLISDPQCRLINDENDLVEVILESLERLQVWLRGRNNPAVDELWNHDGKGNKRRNFRPKDEEFISDYVARRLDNELGRQGLIVNREVQPIRAKRTDILVQMNIPPGQELRGDEELSLSVTIETKGSWNPSLSTSVKTQLVDDYLLPFGRTHGIYLVAWFDCPRSEEPGNSLGVKSLEEARARINELCSPYDGTESSAVVSGVVLDARLD